MGSLKIGDYFKKTYESEPFNTIEPKQNVIIRLDGVAFHTFTKKFKKPFDNILSEAMIQTAKTLCESIHGCVMAYTQSDEISLLINDYSSDNAQGWFGFKRQKLISVSASMCTLFFNEWLDTFMKEYTGFGHDKNAFFDARVLVVKDEDVPSYFKWRTMDAIRNSKLAFGMGYYSHKQLMNKNTTEIVQMVKDEKGADWNKIPDKFKYGMYIIKNLVPKIMSEDHYDKDNPKHIMIAEVPHVLRKEFILDNTFSTFVTDEGIKMLEYFEENNIKYKNI